jgi:hypothetical protein
MFYSEGIISDMTFLIIVLIGVSVFLLTLNATIKAFKIKRFVCDNEYFYLFYEYKMVKRIALSDIAEIGSGQFRFALVIRYKFMYIRYLKGWRMKQLSISEDSFSVGDIMFIFRELAKYAISQNKPILDANHWL